MPLDSSSTNDEVWEAYDDAASYEETGDVTLARSFITACRILLRRMPRRVMVDGVATEFNADSVRDELERARRFVSAKRSGGRHKYFDLGDCRD